MIKDRSYFRDYLRGFLVDEDDPRKDDETFIDGRADRAEGVMEDARRNGATVNQAEEEAMAVLMEGL